MLSPDQRALFLQSLQPPAGYQFDCGIGTTFTLDLLTLLIAPLSLALFEVESAEAALQDPVLLLEGIQRHADRLAIFCQAGRIAIPRKDSTLYRLLEPIVVEVHAPGGGVFHPKVWLLRYESENNSGPPLYRLLNLSRNLTFDNSQDLMLRLEGYLSTERQYAYARNHPLGDFVQRLPELALRQPSSRILAQLDNLQDEVRRVDFQVPEPFHGNLSFHPSGIRGYNPYRFRGRWDRALVVSPFLTDAVLQRVTEGGTGHVLVSRADCIAALKPETRQAFEKLYVLHDLGVEEEAADSVDRVGEEVAGTRHEPLGLHAKLFIREAGWDATWLIGSANATNAAFSRRNVEFMVELPGRKSRIGIDKVLGEGEENSLYSLLRVYLPADVEGEVDKEAEQAERLADEVRGWLLGSGIKLAVSEQEDDLFDLCLQAAPATVGQPEGKFTVTCWPVSLPEVRSQPFCASTTTLTFSGISLLALTSFVAFQVISRVGSREHLLRFVLNLPIKGVPEAREDHILRAILSDRTQFLRYLRMLLADPNDAAAYWLNAEAGSAGRWKAWSSGEEMALLEVLVRALSRSRPKIARIAEIVAGLERTAEGREVFPDGFRSLWEAIVKMEGEFE